jgi:hypothetical protein
LIRVVRTAVSTFDRGEARRAFDRGEPPRAFDRGEARRVVGGEPAVVRAAILVSNRIAREARRWFAGNITVRGISSSPLPIRCDDFPFIATTYLKFPSRQKSHTRAKLPSNGWEVAATDGKSPQRMGSRRNGWEVAIDVSWRLNSPARCPPGDRWPDTFWHPAIG